MSVRNIVRGASSSWPLLIGTVLATLFVNLIPGNSRAAGSAVTRLLNEAAVTVQTNELALIGGCKRSNFVYGDGTRDFVAVAFAAFWQLVVREPERHESSNKPQ